MPFAVFVLVLFYLMGFLLTLGGIANRNPGMGAMGGLLLFGGVYYTRAWIRAKRKDDAASDS
jgi:hypothetical protein